MRLKLWKETRRPIECASWNGYSKRIYEFLLRGRSYISPSTQGFRELRKKFPHLSWHLAFPEPPKKIKPVQKVIAAPNPKAIPPKPVVPVLKDTSKKTVPVISNLPKKEPAKPTPELIKRKQNRTSQAYCKRSRHQPEIIR